VHRHCKTLHKAKAESLLSLPAEERLEQRQAGAPKKLILIYNPLLKRNTLK
jgi:hypothetical protein